MKLHDPAYLKLPALKYEKQSDRQKIEDDQKVNNLISSKQLLDLDLNGLLQKIKIWTNEIESILEELIREMSVVKREGMVTVVLSKEEAIEYMRWGQKLKSVLEKQEKAIEKRMNELIIESLKKVNSPRKRKLNSKSRKILNLLDAFEKRKNIELDILTSRTIYFCRQCKSLIAIDKFHSTNCGCEKIIDSVSKAESLTFHYFSRNMLSFIDDNIWLEHGIDYLLRKKNFITLCGVYVLGHSGVMHEIDNIAELKNKNIRIFCECKNRTISVRDVFIFSGKMTDIGCSRGYIFTTAPNIQKGIKQLARAKNISIIESVLKKSESEIMDLIKE